MMEHKYGARRRSALCARLAEQDRYQDVDAVLLVGAFEHSGRVYQPDAYMRYYTGLTDPGLCAIIERSGKVAVYEPVQAQDRSVWVTPAAGGFMRDADKHMTVLPAGAAMAGYHASLWSPLEHFQEIINRLESVIAQGKKVGVLLSPGAWSEHTKTFLLRISEKLPKLREYLVDCGMVAAHQRSVKDADELRLVQDAVELTVSAQVAAMSEILRDEHSEKALAALIGSFFFLDGEGNAFESIVAGGRNAAILHHTPGEHQLNEREMILVDIGGRKHGYCGDITRTYPGDGERYSATAKTWYDLVHDAQQYAQSITKPGMWLNNAAQPEQSVHHKVVAWFKQRNMDAYFPHSIGHYLGLEVHDVGDYTRPLEPGMVLTLEPGLYDKSQGIGIRLEDNYVVTPTGVKRLSHELPQSVQQIVGMFNAIERDLDSEDEDDEDWQA
jgi:Xaa-Pro aminopeptidase